MAQPLGKPPLWMISRLRKLTRSPMLECRRILESATLDEYKRISGEQGHSYRVDPAEDDPQLATALLRATLEVEAELEEEDPYGMGFCHLFWHAKQRILRERYGIEWKTPVELNPEILFD